MKTNDGDDDFAPPVVSLGDPFTLSSTTLSLTGFPTGGADVSQPALVGLTATFDGFLYTVTTATASTTVPSPGPSGSYFVNISTEGTLSGPGIIGTTEASLSLTLTQTLAGTRLSRPSVTGAFAAEAQPTSAPVPEPASLALAGIAVAGFGARTLRRKVAG